MQRRVDSPSGRLPASKLRTLPSRLQQRAGQGEGSAPRGFLALAPASPGLGLNAAAATRRPSEDDAPAVAAAPAAARGIVASFDFDTFLGEMQGGTGGAEQQQPSGAAATATPASRGRSAKAAPGLAATVGGGSGGARSSSAAAGGGSGGLHTRAMSASAAARKSVLRGLADDRERRRAKDLQKARPQQQAPSVKPAPAVAAAAPSALVPAPAVHSFSFGDTSLASLAEAPDATSPAPVAAAPAALTPPPQQPRPPAQVAASESFEAYPEPFYGVSTSLSPSHPWAVADRPVAPTAAAAAATATAADTLPPPCSSPIVASTLFAGEAPSDSSFDDGAFAAPGDGFLPAADFVGGAHADGGDVDLELDLDGSAPHAAAAAQPSLQPASAFLGGSTASAADDLPLPTTAAASAFAARVAEEAEADAQPTSSPIRAHADAIAAAAPPTAAAAAVASCLPLKGEDAGVGFFGVFGAVAPAAPSAAKGRWEEEQRRQRSRLTPAQEKLAAVLAGHRLRAKFNGKGLKYRKQVADMQGMVAQAAEDVAAAGGDEESLPAFMRPSLLRVNVETARTQLLAYLNSDVQEAFQSKGSGGGGAPRLAKRSSTAQLARKKAVSEAYGRVQGGGASDESAVAASKPACGNHDWEDTPVGGGGGGGGMSVQVTVAVPKKKPAVSAPQAKPAAADSGNAWEDVPVGGGGGGGSAPPDKAATSDKKPFLKRGARNKRSMTPAGGRTGRAPAPQKAAQEHDEHPHVDAARSAPMAAPTATAAPQRSARLSDGFPSPQPATSSVGGATARQPSHVEATRHVGTRQAPQAELPSQTRLVRTAAARGYVYMHTVPATHASPTTLSHPQAEQRGEQPCERLAAAGCPQP